MSREAAFEFIRRHGMSADRIDPIAEAGTMREVMEEGLRGEAILPMIPTYLQADETVPVGKTAIVIDAGGTNFRTGLITFTEDGPVLSRMHKTLMPGIGTPASWEDFISFIADAVEPLEDRIVLIPLLFEVHTGGKTRGTAADDADTYILVHTNSSKLLVIVHSVYIISHPVSNCTCFLDFLRGKTEKIFSSFPAYATIQARR